MSNREEFGWSTKAEDGHVWYSKDRKTWYRWEQTATGPKKIWQ